MPIPYALLKYFNIIYITLWYGCLEAATMILFGAFILNSHSLVYFLPYAHTIQPARFDLIVSDQAWELRVGNIECVSCVWFGSVRFVNFRFYFQIKLNAVNFERFEFLVWCEVMNQWNCEHCAGINSSSENAFCYH